MSKFPNQQKMYKDKNSEEKSMWANMGKFL